SLSLLLLAGCAARVESGLTGVEIDVTYDVAVDQLRFAGTLTPPGGVPTPAFPALSRPDAARTLSPTGESVVVLLPDADDGDAFLARVDGLSSGAVVASAGASTTLVRGTIVVVMIHLGAPARCGDGEVRVPIEACDDGGTLSGDGCSPDCTI